MKNHVLISSALVLGCLANSVAAADNWYVRPYVGLSQMSDLETRFDNIDGLSGQAEVDLDDGFVSGIGLGYRYNDNLAAEVGWEYRSNDSAVTLAGASTFDDGNYASNMLYVNMQYAFDRNGGWQPYVGAGLTWLQEIDIDLERSGQELSYSGDGDIGYQLFAGINYDLNQNWKLQTELRLGSISDIDLDGEGSSVGSFSGIDYETTSLQVGLVYEF